jgi:hypothetical protein
MLIPMIVSCIFVLAVVVLCFAKPNAGRIFLGFFFLAMALGVNGSFTFGNPQAYLDYASGALIPLYRDLTTSVIAFISPFVFGILVMGFEITMGALILYKRNFVKVGLLGTMLFLAGMAPLSWLQLPWLGLIIAEVHLFQREFEYSLWDMLMSAFNKGKSNASNKT